MKIPDINISLDEAIKRWNEGDQVWSIELGGIGPAYEQVIQILLFEFLSRWERKPILSVHDFEVHCHKVTTDLDEKLQGPTGAQHGAAHVMAYTFIHSGYSEILQSVKRNDDPEKKTRLILVCKHFPSL